MSRAALAQITDPSNISRSFASSHDAESLKAAQSLLSDIETAEKEFWQAQSRLSVEEAVSVQDEIIRTKKEVSRLRAWYIACETKLEFIEHFNKPVAEVLLPLDARAIAEQETAVKEAKAAMKEAQARVTKLRSQMRAKARELSSGWTALSEQRTKLTELAQGKENGSIPFEQGGAPRPEELESWRALNQSTASFGHCDPSMLAMMDEAQCRAILEAQLAAMEQLQASALAVGAKIALLEQELPSLKSATARLADQADAMERRDAVDNGACSERALEERLQWYKSMKQILCKLGNVTVEWDGARGQLLLCTEGHALALQFDSEHEKFLRVELRMMASSSDSLTGSVHASNLTTSICTGSSAPVCCVHAPLVSDVIQRAIETQDISYLLSESQQRLKKAKFASDALRQASEKLGQARTVEAHSAVRSSACSSSPSTQRVGRDVEGPCSAVHISSPVSCACTGRPHASTLRLRLQLTPEFPLPKATQPSAPSSVLVSAVAMECAGPCDSKNQQQFCARVKAAANSMANHDIAATVMAVERAVSHTA